MSYFLCQLIAPRPTFAQDMTPDEAKTMSEHGAYWQALADRKTAVLFGPVLDPAGAWGMGIVEAESDAEVRALTEKDPAILSRKGLSYRIHPMLRAVLRKGL